MREQDPTKMIVMPLTTVKAGASVGRRTQTKAVDCLVMLEAVVINCQTMAKALSAL